jgi:hypothetical protein
MCLVDIKCLPTNGDSDDGDGVMIKMSTVEVIFIRLRRQ